MALLDNIGDKLLAFAANRPASDVRQQRITRNLLGDIEQLPQGQVLDSPQFEQLATVNPERAKAIGQPLLALDERREQALATDALRVDKLLDEGFTPQATKLLQNRIDDIIKLGGDPTDTQEILNTLQNEGSAAARTLLRPTLIAGQSRGLIPTGDGSEFKGMNKDKTKAFFLKTDGTIKTVDTGAGVPAADAAEVKSSEILDDGTTIQIMKSGKVNVTGPEGNLIPEGPERAMLIAKAQRFSANLQGDRALQRAGKTQAVKMGKDAFEKLGGIRKGITNLTDAIGALDKGAETGVVASRFPSIRAASIELDNLRNQMGLDVIGGTTFGALSESELAFALDTAIPDTLEGPALKDWLVRKRTAQTKMAEALTKQAKFFSKGGTIAELLEKQERAGGSPPQRTGDQVLTFDAQGNPV